MRPPPAPLYPERVIRYIMQRPSATLPPLQEQVVLRLSLGDSISAAAKAAGVHRSTIYDWLRSNPDFALNLRWAQIEYRDILYDERQDMTRTAFTTLRSVLESESTPVAVRVKLAFAILDHPSFRNLNREMAEIAPATTRETSPTAEPARQNPTLSDTSGDVSTSPSAPEPKIVAAEPLLEPKPAAPARPNPPFAVKIARTGGS